MRITLPDGTVKSYDEPVSGARVAADIGPGLAKAAVGVRVDEEVWDLARPIDRDCHLAIITRPRTSRKGAANGGSSDANADALYLLRHSSAHVMAEAICRLWPDALLAYGPPLDDGFFYDLYLESPISTDDFARIEQQMQSIIDEDRPFTRHELPAAEGMAKLKAEGNKYKIDNAERAIAGGAESLSWYVNGETQREPESPHPEPELFEDLCMGPHIPSTGAIGAFKVMSVATSHWRGDVNSDRFQRVYGTAYFDKADLEAHLERLEEAGRRDHRVVGPRLGLFAIDERVGQGLILWTPRGAVVRQVLQDFIMQHLRRQGYDQVFTPHIGKLDLYKTSGHYPYYQQSQYPPLIGADQISALADEGATCGELANRMQRGDIDGYLLKPMNCPHHICIYSAQKRSYRDLPVRLAEFGTVYRWEQSGEIGGLTRVRGFTQDDAHIFCTEQQLPAEVLGCIELVKIIFGTLGMTDYRIRVGLRDPNSDKYVGESDNWDKAEQACRDAAESLAVDYTVEPGEAAFYGPKIDFIVKDVLGRQWQLGTVQVDYNLPSRFDLSYVGPDNQSHRPVMIHRAPFGSMERFIGVLIEHFAGAFPLWLAPEQVRVLPVSDKFLAYGRKIHEALKDDQWRCSIDDSNERVNAKVKVAQDMKVPYMLVVGGRDEQAGTVSVRCRTRGDLGAMPTAQFFEQAKAEVKSYGKSTVVV